MDVWLWVIIVAVAAASIVGPLIWIGVVAFFAKKSLDAAEGLGLANPQLDAILMQLEALMRAAAASQGQPGLPSTPQMTPQQQMQFQTMLMQAQNQMAQLDDLSRQRYETSMAGLQGYAAANGLDWTPGSY